MKKTIQTRGIILLLFLSGAGQFCTLLAAGRKIVPPDPESYVPGHEAQASYVYETFGDNPSRITMTSKSVSSSESSFMEGESGQPSYVYATFGPKSFVSSAASAAIGQARGRPTEWGGGMEGFGRRMGSGFATHLVKNTIAFPIAAIRHEDLRYHRSNETGFGPRLRYALLSTVITRKTTTGQKTFASGNVTGTVGASLLSRFWQPAAFHTLASGFSTMGISFGAQAGWNVAHEFWPQHKKSAPPAPEER